MPPLRTQVAAVILAFAAPVLGLRLVGCAALTAAAPIIGAALTTADGIIRALEAESGRPLAEADKAAIRASFAALERATAALELARADAERRCTVDASAPVSAKAIDAEADVDAARAELHAIQARVRRAAAAERRRARVSDAGGDAAGD